MKITYAGKTEKTNLAIVRAKEDISAEKICIALIRDEDIIYSTQGRGVKPLLDVLDDTPELLKGSIVVDKIVGRAAALLMILGGVKEVHALTMSRGAQAELNKSGIHHEADHLTDIIINRRGDGSCPMEKAVENITNPQEAPAVLKATIEAMMRKSVEPTSGSR